MEKLVQIKLIFLGLILLFLVGVARSCVDHANEFELFPYGSSIAHQMDENEVTVHIDFDFDFPLFNASHGIGTIFDMTIYKTGILEFYNPFTIIYAYHVDIKTTDGDVFYEQSKNPILIAKAESEIRKKFPNEYLNIKWMFIVTWDKIFTRTCSFLSSTYQATLATDGVKSFIIFYYHQLSSWKICDPDPTSSSKAKTGFLKEDAEILLPGSETKEILNLTIKSNIGEPGKWVFRIDQPLTKNSILSQYGNTCEATTGTTGKFFWIILALATLLIK